MRSLPPYASRQLVAERLQRIFPEGTPNRNYCIRELAASTVFAGLYTGAIENSGCFFGPIHVYRMTVEQAAKSNDSAREGYATEIQKRNGHILGKRWYADNTREPIRDETLRDGLVAVGAVTRRNDLPTTSGQPRYALKVDFAALFDPALQGVTLESAIVAFQNAHLSKSALARVQIMLAGAGVTVSGVLVTFPNGETRQLAPGPSSLIAQSVIEVFVRRFLEKPAVLWLSESGNKIVVRDDSIANAIGLKIEPDKNLPDMILADMGPTEPLIVFVEIVATDGAITTLRKKAIHDLTDAAGFDRKQIAFLTAYRDRESAGFKKTAGQLGWGTCAWFMSEPDQIVILRDGEKHKSLLSELMEP
jgi:hypothetical protein